MAKKKGARPARKTGATAKARTRKASAPARRTAAARKAPKAAKSRAARSGRKAAKPVRKAAKPARAARPATRKSAAARSSARSRKPAPKKAKKQVVKAKASTSRARSVKAARPAKAATPARSTPVKKAAAAPKSVPAVPRALQPVRAAKKANLDRPRRTVAEIHGVPSSLDLDRGASAVRTGRAEMEQKLHQHTETSPALTAGDVDADWGAAASSGDEAPGGDNPTPDQDVVEEIGRALGVEYDDDEELQGGDEIAARDRHRWELDPESSDDFDER